MPRIGDLVMCSLQSLSFFPGQPALVKAAAWLLRLSPTSPCELAWAAVAVSCMSTLGAAVALYALTLEVRRLRTRERSACSLLSLDHSLMTFHAIYRCFALRQWPREQLLCSCSRLQRPFSRLRTRKDRLRWPHLLGCCAERGTCAYVCMWQKV